VLFSAFDAVLTRAGGGTVNDALAHRVPLLLVEEKHMWQALQLKPPSPSRAWLIVAAYS
jgi:UDP-N-acetylglucosamine:LPS N-acetylglucosamine transferase